jgi:hypothetical protein
MDINPNDYVNPKQVRRMAQFLNEVKAADVAMTSRLNTADASRGAGGSKQPTYAPPPEYTAVEMLVDLDQAMGAGDYIKALPIYYNLKRLLNR